MKENVVKATVNKILNYCNVKMDPKKFPPRKYRLTAEFSRDKSYLYGSHLIIKTNRYSNNLFLDLILILKTFLPLPLE